MEELKLQEIEQEIVIRRKDSVKGVQFLENTAQELGLYFRAYNKEKDEILVVSKVPLPNYRADLDEMHGSMQREIQISMVTECRVESILASASKICAQESMPSESSQMYHSPVHSYEIPRGYGENLLLSLKLCHQQWEVKATPAAVEMQCFRERLPAYKMKDQLLTAVANNQVLNYASIIIKIIIATNIAETSITIEDVVFVVDCGKAKQSSYDALNKLSCLSPYWISKLLLISYQKSSEHLWKALCLQIKCLRIQNVANFLAKALQLPEPLAVQNAIDLLKTIGALNDMENLTSLGRHLSTLPLDPKVGKMLLMGVVFQCLSPTLTIAATLSYRDPFILSFERRCEADKARKKFAGDSN
ncbi:hypothetical protein KI387_027651, partial [Taxus chinensis]